MFASRDGRAFHFFATLLLASAVIGPPRRAAAAEPSAESACRTLVRQVDEAPSGPVFLASYPTVSAGPLHNAAFLYDNAAAAIALVGCGEGGKARRIGDAILLALNNDRFWHDGRLRNGYAAGAVGGGPVKLAGWWDNDRQQWLEDRYQVGSDTGNMAWAMLALLALDTGEGGGAYRAGAERIGNWIVSARDPRGSGGFTGGTFGHEPVPANLSWKSTEHNTDLVAAFNRLADATGKVAWRAQAAAAEQFVEAMWDADCRCFATGSGDDGVTRNPWLALDAQAWPLIALEGADSRFGAVLQTVDERLRFGDGFAYGQALDGMWTEGTAQMALVYALIGKGERALALQAAVARQRSPAGGYYATDRGEVPTGFMLSTDPTKPRLYFRLPHLGATAWAALAERRFNPFTGTTALPAGPAGSPDRGHHPLDQ